MCGCGWATRRAALGLAQYLGTELATERVDAVTGLSEALGSRARTPSDEQLHGIRIAAKNLRYSCELSRPVVGKAAGKTARLAENLQTVRGEYHDASGPIDWLTQAGTTGPAWADVLPAC